MLILVIDTTKIEEKWWKESFDQKLAKVTRIKKLCCSWLMQSCGQSNTSWLTVLCKQSTWKVCLSGKNLSVNKANALMFWKTHYIRSESKWFCSFQIRLLARNWSGFFGSDFRLIEGCRLGATASRREFRLCQRLCSYQACVAWAVTRANYTWKWTKCMISCSFADQWMVRCWGRSVF